MKQRKYRNSTDKESIDTPGHDSNCVSVPIVDINDLSNIALNSGPQQVHARLLKHTTSRVKTQKLMLIHLNSQQTNNERKGTRTCKLPSLW